LPEAIANYIKLSKQKCNKISDTAYIKLAELYVKNNQVNEAKKSLQKALQSKYLDIAEQAKKELDKL
jgi:Tfp pilus assembly protein PilF